MPKPPKIFKDWELAVIDLKNEGEKIQAQGGYNNQRAGQVHIDEARILEEINSFIECWWEAITEVTKFPEIVCKKHAIRHLNKEKSWLGKSFIIIPAEKCPECLGERLMDPYKPWE